MARTKRVRRSYGAGEWGRNRVRVFPDPKTGLFQIEWRENGRGLTRSLKHRDWRSAKRQADEFAAGFAGPELNGKKNAEPEPLTLGTLFDIYGEEVTPTKKGSTSRMHDRAATAMFLDFLRRDRRPETLSRRDWDRFIRERRAGRIGPSGKPVSDQTIGGDLTFLMAVLNWAARSRDEHGRLLLDRNPLKGLRKPVQKNPVRVVITDKEYQALLKVSRRVGLRFHVALVLAHETGHRIGAIRNLRWADIDLDGETIRWRSEHEKTGIRAPDPVVRPGARRSQAGVEVEPRDRGRAGAALGDPSLEVREPVAAARLVVQSRATRGDGAQAPQGLALAEAQVCQRPDGPAAQSALRTRRLEERQDGAQLLPEAGRGTASEGSGSPPRGARLKSHLAGIKQRELDPKIP